MADDGLSRDEHLAMAHAHAEAAHAHAGDTVAHLTAARDETDATAPDEAAGSDGGPGTGKLAGAPSAQARAFSYAPGSGAARSLRAMTGGRRG